MRNAKIKSNKIACNKVIIAPIIEQKGNPEVDIVTPLEVLPDLNYCLLF